MRVFSLSLVVCVLVWAGFAAHAQRTPVAAIVGHVIDRSGTPVAGATVRLTGSGIAPRSTLTDAGGAFRLDDVPAATYELEVLHDGYVTLKRPVAVTAGGPGTVRLRLTLAPSGPRTSLPQSRSDGETGKSLPPPPPAMPAESPRGREGRGPVGAAPPVRVGGSIGGLPDSAASARPALEGDFHRRYHPQPANTESYAAIEDNAFRATTEHPLSTFSIDVDTASYANVRRFLTAGTMPPPDAVRIEEMINYFRFDYAQPRHAAPFAVTTEVAPAPWNPRHRLALIGLQARPIDEDRRVRRNLVFLIDVSGSMSPDDKLPLVRKSMRMLVDTLDADDRIAIVGYAGASGLVLPATPGSQKDRIHQAIARLEAGGSTNGGAGITLAYEVARAQFVRGGINRVILATDGDFNVGVTHERDLVRLIEEQREAGVFLSVLGVGTGNLKDSTMEKLADKGNGNYSYLDSLHEARKVLVAEAGGTLVTVAKDVKIQVEFNPAHVAAYRLIGYENRVLRNEDFNNDRKDAGEIGAGHTVTALYELVPPGAEGERPLVDPLRYQRTPVRQRPPATGEHADELMTVKLRYKAPDEDASRLLSFPVASQATPRSDNVGFAAAVAQFGMLLRRSEHKGAATYRDAAALARRHRGADESGYRAELIRLIELAEAMTRQTGYR